MNNKKNDIDIFQKYLKSEEKYIKIALTDSSYKNYCEKHNLSFCDDNKNLATLGDAIIKFVYAKMLYNECKNKKYSKEIEKYITDEKLVRIASKYDLIQYIDLDEDDDKIRKDYDYVPKKGKSPHKYIATAVEAMVAAIYNNNNLEEIEKICEYISDKLKNIDASNRLREKVMYNVLLLEDSPKMFVEIEKTDKTKRAYRKIIVDNYTVLYTIDEENKIAYIAHIYYRRQNYIY